jgi:hypothetical protein
MEEIGKQLQESTESGQDNLEMDDKWWIHN